MARLRNFAITARKAVLSFSSRVVQFTKGVEDQTSGLCAPIISSSARMAAVKVKRPETDRGAERASAVGPMRITCRPGRGAMRRTGAGLPTCGAAAPARSSSVL